MTVFDANTFGHDEVPVPDSYTEGMKITQDVLIDVDGNRDTFRVGWYDHDDGEWRLHDVNAMQYIDNHMRWSFLPLAIYDTNPELRKTIKL